MRKQVKLTYDEIHDAILMYVDSKAGEDTVDFEESLEWGTDDDDLPETVSVTLMVDE